MTHVALLTSAVSSFMTHVAICWRQVQYVESRYRALLISYSLIRNLILLPCDLVWRQRVSADQLLWSISANVMWLSCVTVSTSCDHVGGSREDQFQSTSCDCLASQFLVMWPCGMIMWWACEVHVRFWWVAWGGYLRGPLHYYYILPSFSKSRPVIKVQDRSSP